ncbi:MAG: exodeoxyribonuclease VII small subunit [Lachnospiraceae bacterium]|nr:exodeoxyribonuclease VII small subunit [Lachnospiraceae bacterium]
MPTKKSDNSTDKEKNDKSKKHMSLEEAFEELDELIRHMDDEKISLEDSFNSYKKGLELIKMCNDSIGDIEGKLEILESGDNEE